MAAEENVQTGTLVRGLGLVAAISVIIGNVIGTGVFLKARVMTCNVGTPGWVIAAWVAAGLLSLAGALAYGLLSTNVLGYQLEISTLQIVAIMVIVIFTTLNCASVSVSGQIATVLTAVKIFLI